MQGNPFTSLPYGNWQMEVPEHVRLPQLFMGVSIRPQKIGYVVRELRVRVRMARFEGQPKVSYGAGKAAKRIKGEKT